MDEPIERGAQLGGRLDADDRGAGGQRDLDVRPAMSVTRAPRSSAASAIATPILPGRAVADEADRVDRLARPAGGHDDVPAGEVGVARRGRRAAGAPPGPAARTGRSADGRDDRVDDRAAARPAARRPICPEASGPAVGLDDRVAEVVAQPRDVGDGSPGGVHMSPSIAGATTTGRRRREAGRGRRRRRPARRPSPPASARSPARRRSRRRCRRRRCGRSARRAAGRGRRSRPGGATARRTSAAPTKRVADGVSMTATSAPSARSRRSSSTAL